MNQPIPVGRPAHQPRIIATIFLAGAAAGVLDITAAFVTSSLHGYTPLKVLQGIASGALGSKSFEGGWSSGFLGILIHFLIAFSTAAVFYIASRKVVWMRRRPISSGALYGVAVYVFMYWMVVPLSAIGWQKYSIDSTIRAIVIHIVCVGLPIAFIVRHFANDPVVSSNRSFPRRRAS
jgi:hypothetical protein